MGSRQRSGSNCDEREFIDQVLDHVGIALSHLMSDISNKSGMVAIHLLGDLLSHGTSMIGHDGTELVNECTHVGEIVGRSVRIITSPCMTGGAVGSRILGRIPLCDRGIQRRSVHGIGSRRGMGFRGGDQQSRDGDGAEGVKGVMFRSPVALWRKANGSGVNLVDKGRSDGMACTICLKECTKRAFKSGDGMWTSEMNPDGSSSRIGVVADTNGTAVNQSGDVVRSTVGILSKKIADDSVSDAVSKGGCNHRISWSGVGTSKEGMVIGKTDRVGIKRWSSEADANNETVVDLSKGGRISRRRITD